MPNMHSREDAFDLGVAAFDLGDPEARTVAQDIALRDALLRRYPLQPTHKYEARVWGGSWQVVRQTTALTTTSVCVAEHLTEEHARIFADVLNAKAFI